MKKIEYFLEKINTKNKEKLIKMHKYFLENFSDSKGSSYNHQTWEWWYFDHIKDILNFAEILFETINSKIKKVDFELQDAFLVLFLHDIEKPIKYSKNNILEFQNLKTNEDIRNFLIKKFDIKLNELHKNALKYIHWEWKDYSNKKRVSSPLATFCHICDVMSARIYFDKI